MVKSDVITRIARGVYRRTCHRADLPSVVEVAKVKAAAFARNIYTYGDIAAIKSGLVFHLPTESPTNLNHSGEVRTREVVVFYTDGPTTSFLYGEIEVQFKGACPRKRQLVDDKVGLLLKSLWFLGRVNVDFDSVHSLFVDLNSLEKKVLFAQLTQMPEWMRKVIPRRIHMRFREFDLYGPPMFESTIDKIHFLYRQNFNKSLVFY